MTGVKGSQNGRERERERERENTFGCIAFSLAQFIEHMVYTENCTITRLEKNSGHVR
jgi:hypothetical protein